MSHPWYHSISSSRSLGGTSEEHWPVHAFLDDSKRLFTGAQHRSLRHHIEGLREMTQTLGEFLFTASGDRIPTMTIGMQHLREDFGGQIPTLQHWADALSLPLGFLPDRLPSLEEQCAASVQRFGGAATDYEMLHRWMDEDLAEIHDLRRLFRRHHAQGAFDAERRFGQTIAKRDSRPATPTRLIAELHIRQALGRIPTFQDWLTHMAPKDWMGAGAIKLSKTLPP